MFDRLQAYNLPSSYFPTPKQVITNVAAAKVVVTDVSHGCAASGLLVKGDRIVSINGTRITDEVQGRALAKAAVGEVIFSIQRGYEHVNVGGADYYCV